MSLSNTPRAYGSLARALHWAVALLILVNIPLAWWAKGLPHASDADVALLARIYSAHKTIGVTVLALAVVRVLWTLTQPKPVPLHPGRRVETFVAEAVHWLLYAAILIMPVSGWISHAASEGFAPILWPIGQSLPLVPKSETVSRLFATIHGGGAKLLILSLLLHVAGALKHALVDRDGTLARMVTGRPAGTGAGRIAHAPAALLALALWGLVVAGLFTLAPSSRQAATPRAAAAESGDWAVTDGTITFTVRQMEQDVTGRLDGWTARITYDPATKSGETEVTIPLSGLSLGAVTVQAAGPEFFARDSFPEARFRAAISEIDGQLIASGTLSLRGQDVPVALPFTLDIEGETATAQGEALLDRRDFGMGPSYPDETTVGFPVRVRVTLTATRR